MKKWANVFIVALFLTTSMGCGQFAGTTASRQASSDSTSSASTVKSAAVSSKTESSAAPSKPAEKGRSTFQPAGLQKGDTVSITGENNDFQLHSIDFLDENTGWVVEDRYNGQTNTTSSQLMKTDDGGKSWKKTGTADRMLDTIYFTDSKTGWAVSSEKAGADPNSGKVRYSILSTLNGGADWSVQWNNNTAIGEGKPSLWFQNREAGFALTANRLLRTRDGGKKWSAVSFGVKDFVPQHMVFTDAQNGWVTGASAKQDRLFVLHTPDGGKSWMVQFQKRSSDSSDVPLETLGVDFISGKEGWFLSADYATLNGELYHTTDGGTHWNPVSQIKSARPRPDDLCFVSSQVGWIPLDVGAGPIDGGLSVTRDGGKSFQIVDEGTNPDEETRKVASAREITFMSPREGWAVGMDLNRGDYLLKTTDGGSTWEQMLPALEPTRDLSFPDSQNGFGLGALSDSNAILKTVDGGEHWETVTSLTGKYRTEALSFVDPSEGWLLAWAVSNSGATEFSNVLHTTDGGKHWKNIGRLPYNESECSYFQFFDAKNGMIMEQQGSGILLTADGGKTWKSSTSAILRNKESLFYFVTPLDGWPLSVPNGYDCRAVTFFSARHGMILAENSGGRLVLLETRDGRKTWEPHLFPKGAEELLDILGNRTPMRFADDLNGWILTDNGFLYTEDGGRSWVWY